MDKIFEIPVGSRQANTPGSKRKYVVVDSNDYWATYGEFGSPEEAIEDAINSGNLDNPEKVYVFEVVNEYQFTKEVKTQWRQL